MSHRIEIADPAGEDEPRVLTEGDLGSIEFSREHTAMGDFQARLGLDASLENYALGEVNIWWNDRHLFRGYLETVDSAEANTETTIEGSGIGQDLTNGSAAVHYEGIEAWQAVADYWQNHVEGFDATVHEPPASRVEDGEKQAADTTGEFEGIVGAGPTAPVAIRDGRVDLLDSGVWVEGPEFDTGTVEPDGAASGGEGLRLEHESDDAFVGAPFEYDLPGEQVDLAVRARAPSGTAPGVEFRFEGNTTLSFDAGESVSDSYEWFVETVELPENLPAGEHNVALDVTDENGEALLVDAVIPLDSRFDYTFPDDVNADGYLDGPETVPHAWTLVFESVEVGARVVEIDVSASLTDTSGGQLVGASLDGETWDDAENAENYTAEFPGSLQTSAFGRVRLSRHGSRSDASPAQGFEGQSITSWSLTVESENPARIGDQRFEGTHLQNLQRLHERAGMRFVVAHDPDERTAESFAPGDVVKSAEWRMKDRTRRLDTGDYANVVTVRGARDSSGERYSARAKSGSAVAQFGEQAIDETDPNLETQTEVENRAVSLLLERLNELELTGEQTIVPMDVEPGYSYPVEWGGGDETETPLERVEYSDGAGGLDGRLAFDPKPALELELVALRGRQARTESAV